MLARPLLFLVRAYRKFLSPVLPDTCRYHPSCSHYAEQALERHGAFKGSVLALRRVARCHPFTAGGDDPVPD